MRFPFQQIGVALIAVGWGLPAVAATTITAPLPPTTSDVAPAIGHVAPASAEIERSDLIAQQRMADAADRMADLTAAQVWIAAVGSGLVAASLFFSAQATRAGFRAAKAAEDALANQQRPRLMVDEIGISDFSAPISEMVGERTQITLKHKNHGSGFGWIKDFSHRTSIMGLSEEPPLDLGTPMRTIYPIVPGSWWGLVPAAEGGVDIPEDQRSAISQGDALFYYIARVNYIDLNNTEYVLQYIYRYRPSDKSMQPHEHSFWKST